MVPIGMVAARDSVTPSLTSARYASRRSSISLSTESARHRIRRCTPCRGADTGEAHILPVTIHSAQFPQRVTLCSELSAQLCSCSLTQRHMGLPPPYEHSQIPLWMHSEDCRTRSSTLPAVPRITPDGIHARGDTEVQRAESQSEVRSK